MSKLHKHTKSCVVCRRNDWEWWAGRKLWMCICGALREPKDASPHVDNTGTFSPDPPAGTLLRRYRTVSEVNAAFGVALGDSTPNPDGTHSVTVAMRGTRAALDATLARLRIDRERVRELPGEIRFAGRLTPTERETVQSVVAMGILVVDETADPAARMDAALAERKSAAYRARRGWTR